MNADHLARWLKDQGAVEYLHETGYGHMCGLDLAGLLLDTFTMTTRNDNADEDDPLEEAYIEGYDAAIRNMYNLLRDEAFGDDTRSLFIRAVTY